MVATMAVRVVALMLSDQQCDKKIQPDSAAAVNSCTRADRMLSTAQVAGTVRQAKAHFSVYPATLPVLPLQVLGQASATLPWIQTQAEPYYRLPFLIALPR